MHRSAPFRALFILAAVAQVSFAQAAPAAAATVPGDIARTDNRAYGVLPNYRTADSSIPFSPITSKQKFTLAWKDSANGPSYVMGAVFSALSQVNNTNPSFGQGLKGYGHRYITALADQDLGNMLTEGFLPSLLHEDPRFFRKGTGGGWSRAGYAASRVMVTRTDKGTLRFNTSEFLGNGMVAATGNLYYPDARGGPDTALRMLSQIGTDAISNVLKEFWPDVKRKLQAREKH